MELSGRVRLVHVYIAEAHAQDEWPIRSGRYNGSRGPVLVCQPREQRERLRLAERFASDFSLTDVFDSLLSDDLSQGDKFMEAYAPWPFRFWVLQNGTVAHVAHPEDASYNVAALRAFILERCAA